MLRPLLHFLWIGLALFAADRLWWAEEPPAEPVVIGAERVGELQTAFLARTGRMPGESELAALVRADVDDELLYREALAVGFDRDDPVVQRRLLQNMQFAGADPERGAESLVAEAIELGMDKSDPVVRRRLIQRMRLAIEAAALSDPPDEATLRAHYESNLERFVDPARVRLLHLYFDADPPGEASDALREIERTGAGVEIHRERGEAFLHAARQPLQSQRELGARFGEAFAERAFALEPDAWRGPVASSYGEHLVWIEERVEAKQRPFDAVRSEIEYALLAERRRARLAEHLEGLRAGVPVVMVDAP